MPNPKHQSTFRSYVDYPTNNGIDPGKQKRRSLQYLPGETQISMCEHVLRYIPFFDKTQACVGTLYVTNFKIAFITQKQNPHQVGDSKQRNKLIREEDIVLNNVSSVYQVSKGKRKKLSPVNGSSGGYIKNIEIHCKDFRVHTFSFKMSPKDQAKKAASSLIYHCFPGRIDLLFAYDCQLGDSASDAYGAVAGAAARIAPESKDPKVRRYENENDWLQELERLGVRSGFRVLHCNTQFLNCHSLPEAFVVPETIDLPDLKKQAAYFTDYRVPLWSYTCNTGASLVRMAAAMQGSPDASVIEERMIGKIRLTHPDEIAPVVFDLSQSSTAPSLKEIQSSHEKLRDLCMPVNLKDITSKDNNWLSQLDNTNWLHNVSRCLALSVDVVNCMLKEKKSVILKEPNSRDLTPLICCLVQLMLDPHYRTIVGFQELIEREWVALGHDFTSRLGLVLESEPCPLFLLFLDSVWQLHQQFPSAFQFSEIYLTALWDTLCLGLFDNFIFDSIRKRQNAANGVSYGNPNLIFMNGWNWSWQYDKEDQSLFNNPLYKARTELDLKLPRSHKSDHRKGSSLRRMYSMKLSSIHEAIPSQNVRILYPVVKQPMLKLWKHNYLRWVTPVQIKGGGSPSEYLQQCLLVEEILLLQHKIDSLKNEKTFIKSARPNSDLLFSSTQNTRAEDDEGKEVNMTSNLALTSSFPYTPEGAGAPNTSSLSDTLVSAFLENSFIQDSDDDKDVMNSSLEDTLDS